MWRFSGHLDFFRFPHFPIQTQCSFFTLHTIQLTRKYSSPGHSGRDVHGRGLEVHVCIRTPHRVKTKTKNFNLIDSNYDLGDSIFIGDIFHENLLIVDVR